MTVAWPGYFSELVLIFSLVIQQSTKIWLSVDTNSAIASTFIRNIASKPRNSRFMK